MRAPPSRPLPVFHTREQHFRQKVTGTAELMATTPFLYPKFEKYVCFYLTFVSVSVQIGFCRF